MNNSIKVILSLTVILSIISIIQYEKIRSCIKIGNIDIQPWQHRVPNARYKVLFAGDSTAVGTGLLDNSKSTSGLFSQDYPNIDLENFSQNGLRLKGLAKILENLQNKRYDLAILQIGANDILFLTPMDEIKIDQENVLNLTRHIAKRIIIFHSGDIGESPIFIWPLSWFYTWRSLKVRDIYMKNQDDRVSYIDIYTLNKGKDFKDCYGRDHLHLNKEGYAIWYGYIKNQLEQLHWL